MLPVLKDDIGVKKATAEVVQAAAVLEGAASELHN